MEYPRPSSKRLNQSLSDNEYIHTEAVCKYVGLSNQKEINRLKAKMKPNKNPPGSMTNPAIPEEEREARRAAREAEAEKPLNPITMPKGSDDL